jgi:prevent-host-death family protein
MKNMSAKDTKNEFGLLLDTARAEPVTIEKHGRPVAVVVSIEKYDRLLRAAKNSNRTRSTRSAKIKSCK